MMGRAHAVSGAAAWLAGCTAAEAAGAHIGLDVRTVGTLLCAGWALAPDLDHPEATLAHSLGPVSWVAAKGTAKLSNAVHTRTRTGWDRPARTGHRTLTHTLVWAVLWCAIGTVAGLWGGPWAAGTLVAGGTGIGVYAGLPPRWRRIRMKVAGTRIRVDVAPMVGAAAGTWAFTTTSGSVWWLGPAIGVGCFVHCLGDSLTLSGCPWMWPLLIGPAGRKQRWYPIGVPRSLRFQVDGKCENFLVTPVLWLITAALVVIDAYGPGVFLADLVAVVLPG